jgi:hypothetical protein
VTFASLAVLKCSRRVQQLPENISSALQILDVMRKKRFLLSYYCEKFVQLPYEL